MKLAEFGSRGIAVGALAKSLENTPQYVVELLNRFEAFDIVQRHRAGKEVLVTLGLQGKVVLRKGLVTATPPAGQPIPPVPEASLETLGPEVKVQVREFEPASMKTLVHAIHCAIRPLAQTKNRRRVVYEVMRGALPSTVPKQRDKLLIKACDEQQWEPWILTACPSLYVEDIERRSSSSGKLFFIWTDVYLPLLQMSQCAFEVIAEYCLGHITAVRVSQTYGRPFEEFEGVVRNLEDARVKVDFDGYNNVLGAVHHRLSEVALSNHPITGEFVAKAYRQVRSQLNVGVKESKKLS